MILENDYYWFQSALTDEQCDYIISIGESEMKNAKARGDSIDASTFDGKDKCSMLESGLREDELLMQGDSTIDVIKNKGTRDKSFVRDTHISWLNDKEIYSWITPYLNEANLRAGWNFEWDWSESLQFTKYGKKQFYGWHPDANAKPNPPFWDERNPPDGEHYDEVEENGETICIPKGGWDLKENKKKWSRDANYANKIRKLSMTVNLTKPEDYKGGNLKFDFGPHSENSRFHTCKEIRPRGSIIVFPSDRYHQVTPVTHGTRYSLVMWCMGMPWR